MDGRSYFYRLHINDRKSGKLLQERSFTSTLKCLYLEISNKKPFVHIAVNPTKDKIMVADQLGHLYCLSVELNTFRLSAKLNSCVTAMMFADQNNEAGVDLVVATAVYNSIHFLRLEETGAASILAICESVHRTSVNGISMFEDRMLTYSAFDCVSLWNLNTLSITKQMRNYKTMKAEFLSNSLIVVSNVSIQSNSIFLFDAQTLEFKQVFRNKLLINVEKKENMIFVRDDHSKEIEMLNVNANYESKTLDFLTENVKKVVLRNNKVYALKDFGEIETHPESEISRIAERFSTFLISGSLLIGITINGRLQMYELENSGRRASSADIMLDEAVFKSNEEKTQQVAQEILTKYRRFPHNYRIFIWTNILHLPWNEESFAVVQSKAEDATDLAEFSKQKIDDLYFDTDWRLKLNLVKMMRYLISWDHGLKEADWLPVFIYPFCKTFSGKSLLQFELLASLILNEYHICDHEDIFKTIERKMPFLSDFYSDKSVDMKDIVTSIVKSAFSKCFPSQEWLILWDNIIFHGPHFIKCIILSLHSISKDTIISLESKESVYSFFVSQSFPPVIQILEKANKILQSNVFVPTHKNRTLTKSAYTVLRES